MSGPWPGRGDQPQAGRGLEGRVDELQLERFQLLGRDAIGARVAVDARHHVPGGPEPRPAAGAQPADVIDVRVRDEHEPDVVRRDALAGQRADQAAAAATERMLVAAEARVDERDQAIAPDEQAPVRDGDRVPATLRLRRAREHHLGRHHALAVRDQPALE